MQREYSQMYSLLVKGEEDLEGHIAYSLYKQAKIQHIEAHTHKNNGIKPTDKELVAFNEFAENNIEMYRLKARIIFQSLIDGILEETINQVRSEMIDEMRSLLKSDVVAPLSPPSKWYQLLFGGLQSVIGSIMAAIIILILAVFFMFKDIGIYDIIKRISEPVKVETQLKNNSDSLNYK